MKMTVVSLSLNFFALYIYRPKKKDDSEACGLDYMKKGGKIK